jgi:hypothetical protein
VIYRLVERDGWVLGVGWQDYRFVDCLVLPSLAKSGKCAMGIDIFTFL